MQYNTKHPAYPVLQAIGKEITQKVKPTAVVVFSAHWQAEEENTIEVNSAEHTDLIYEFRPFFASFLLPQTTNTFEIASTASRPTSTKPNTPTPAPPLSPTGSSPSSPPPASPPSP